MTEHAGVAHLAERDVANVEAAGAEPVTRSNREVRRVLQRRTRRKLKERAVAYKGGKCTRCGYAKCLDAMCFHHTDVTVKEFAISSATISKWSHIKAELDKCVLLCSNCHLEEHERLNRLMYDEVEGRLQLLKKDNTIKCSKCRARIQNRSLGKVCEGCKARTRARLKSSQLQPDHVRQLLSQYQIPTVAVELNCAETTLRRYCKRNGIPFNKPRPSRIKWPSIEELTDLVGKLPLVRIAKKLGVTDNGVRRRCEKLGIQLPKKGFWLPNVVKQRTGV